MNKFQKFALAMSVLLFEMRCEDLKADILDDNGEEICTAFVDSITYSAEHADAIKERLRLEILSQVEQCPTAFKQDDNDEFLYSVEVYDYAYLVDVYIKERFADTLKKTLFVCSVCGSDNVHVMGWVKPNENNRFAGSTGENDDPAEQWCEDCQQHVGLDTVQVNVRAQVEGFQVISACDKDWHPRMSNDKCLYSLEQANAMLNDRSVHGDWQLLAIYTGEIENAVTMFDDGDPRDLKSSF